MAGLDGYAPLQRRLQAIGDQRGKMGFVATVVVGELKRNIVHKTSGTSRTIHVARVTETSALIVGSSVARWIDEGTGLYGPRHHRIVPKSKKALRWIGGPAGSLTLGGRKRSGKAGAGAGPRFARSVRGMKPRPFVDKSLKSSEGLIGQQLSAKVITDWNKAA